MAFTDQQRNHITQIVHHRVGLEDTKTLIIKTNVALIEAEKEFNKATAHHNGAINQLKAQLDFHNSQLIAAEEELRTSLLEEPRIQPGEETELVTEPEKEVLDHQLGRDA